MFFNTIFLLDSVIISKMYLHLQPNKGEYLPVSCTKTPRPLCITPQKQDTTKTPCRQKSFQVFDLMSNFLKQNNESNSLKTSLRTCNPSCRL